MDKILAYKIQVGFHKMLKNANVVSKIPMLNNFPNEVVNS